MNLVVRRPSDFSNLELASPPPDASSIAGVTDGVTAGVTVRDMSVCHLGAGTFFKNHLCVCCVFAEFFRKLNLEAKHNRVLDVDSGKLSLKLTL